MEVKKGKRCFEATSEKLYLTPREPTPEERERIDKFFISKGIIPPPRNVMVGQGV